MKNTYENVSPTIGVEFAYKVAYLKNKTKVKAQIWDTCKSFSLKDPYWLNHLPSLAFWVKLIFAYIAGSEKYRSITTGHYRFALGAVLLYDVSSAESFKNCKYWLDNIKTYSDENVVIVLVGNYYPYWNGI